MAIGKRPAGREKKPTRPRKRRKAGRLLTEHRRATAAVRDIALLLDGADASVVRTAGLLTEALFAKFIQISIDAIEGCTHHEDSDAWIQSEDATTLTLHFTVRNIGPVAYSGKMTGVLDGMPILSWGEETTVDDLQPGKTATGRMWFSARSGSPIPREIKISFAVPRDSGPTTININPKTGEAGWGGSPQQTIATCAHPYVAGSRSQRNAALIALLGITPVYDSGGRLQSASAVDRFGVYRQIQFAVYEKVTYRTPSTTGAPYDTHLHYAAYVTYSEQLRDGKTHVYDTNQKMGIPDRLVPGRVFSAGFAIDMDDAGSDLMLCNFGFAGFPMGSEVMAAGQSAPSNTAGGGWSVKGSVAERGNVVVSSPLQMDLTVNDTVHHGAYSFQESNPLGGVYSGFNPDIQTLFASELKRFNYFAPLLNEDLIIKQVFDASPSVARANPSVVRAIANRKVSTLPKSRLAALRARMPKNQFSDVPLQLYDGVIVGNPDVPSNSDSILPTNRNEWIGIGMRANCAAAMLLSCKAAAAGWPGALACGAGILAAAVCNHIAGRVSSMPVRQPYFLPQPHRTQRPSGGSGGGSSSPSPGSNEPMQPPLSNPGPPIGSMTCDIGYIEIDGRCVPIPTTAPGGDYSWPW